MIEQELNEIALEIISQKDLIDKLTSELSSPQQVLTKGEKISKGFNFLNYSNLVYCFKRFYPLVMEERLTYEAKELYKELSLETDNYEDVLKNKEKLPKELQEFLDK